MPTHFDIVRTTVFCFLATTPIYNAKALDPQAPILPDGFVAQALDISWDNATGLTFASDGRLFVWEKAGRIWIVENGVRSAQPLLDISDEIGNWRDHGLLGVVLHPDFLNTGYIYLAYVVDRHHLFKFGTPVYDPYANEYFDATIARLTRYRATPESNFEEIDPASRTVLIGETPQDGIPILHQSHGVGSIIFGSDGTLLLTCGDGASYSALDDGGSDGGSYAPQGLSDGIIRPKEDVGAFRAQLIDCHNGKILRVDPATGDGVPSNPFYDPLEPRSPRSRVWALGLRNPFRVTYRPGTGSHNVADADPGVLYVGDVGWMTWEELSVVRRGGENLGWPLFEGLEWHGAYRNQLTSNLDAPNPFASIGSCTQTHFDFQDLLQQDTLDPEPFFANPCDPQTPIPESARVFLHTRPVVDWHHDGPGPARTGVYDGLDADVAEIGTAGSPVAGNTFGGNCAIGGIWYLGDAFPAPYRETYFLGDYVGGWIRNLVFDQADQLIEVREFMSDGGLIVSMAEHPIDGSLYFIQYGATIWKITYDPTGNQPPTAVITADAAYGPSPHSVSFSAGSSFDPEGQPLQYAWDFGDGSPIATEVDPSHVFTAPDSEPVSFTASLTVIDDQGASDEATFLISVNNSPPSVAITNPPDGWAYDMNGDSLIDLAADISDQEHGASELACAWEVVLHHNDHTHPEPIISDCDALIVISPFGCNGEIYFYRIRLTVTDAAGLKSSDEVIVVPDCGSLNMPPLALDDIFGVGRGQSVRLNVLKNDADDHDDLDATTLAITLQPTHGSAVVSMSEADILYTHDGLLNNNDILKYTVSDSQGLISNEATVSLDIFGPCPGDLNGDRLVNVTDLLNLLSKWGTCAPPCPEDTEEDGEVNVTDLLALLAAWGACP